jgi:hypothetical protein
MRNAQHTSNICKYYFYYSSALAQACLLEVSYTLNEERNGWLQGLSSGPVELISGLNAGDQMRVVRSGWSGIVLSCPACLGHQVSGKQRRMTILVWLLGMRRCQDTSESSCFQGPFREYWGPSGTQLRWKCPALLLSNYGHPSCHILLPKHN